MRLLHPWKWLTSATRLRAALFVVAVLLSAFGNARANASYDLVLEDVERIEVIHGPGSTLWGANAVNGVINILTKKAGATQGGYVRVGGGTDEEGFAVVRYGGRLSERVHYRGYAKYLQRAASEDTAGLDLQDDWHMARLGGRIDWDLGSSFLGPCAHQVAMR